MWCTKDNDWAVEVLTLFFWLLRPLECYLKSTTTTHTYSQTNEVAVQREKERIFVKKMAISVSNNSYTEESQTPLLEGTVAGAVDYKGNPVLRANSGGWRSASFMIGIGKKKKKLALLVFLQLVWGLCSISIYCLIIVITNSLQQRKLINKKVNYFYVFRCGNGGEVFILWNSLQSNNVFDGATRTVHGDCSGERECVVWDRAVAAFIGCIYRRFFSWSLPHHRHCYYYLHPGSSPSSPSPLLFFFFFFL